MAITFWNNWNQGEEFIMVDISFRDGAYSLGFFGFGIVIII